MRFSMDVVELQPTECLCADEEFEGHFGNTVKSDVLSERACPKSDEELKQG